jgi:hypothetical protein
MTGMPLIRSRMNEKLVVVLKTYKTICQKLPPLRSLKKRFKIDFGLRAGFFDFIQDKTHHS